jgi:predicted ester cyclase
MNLNNEQLLRQFIAAFEAGDHATLRSMVHPDLIDHTLPPGAAPGIDGLLSAVAAYHQGFADLRISIDQVITAGDAIVGYGRITGTHTGTFFGTPPTGRSADFAYIDIYRIQHGQITETWHLEDIAGLMRQLTNTPDHATI